VAAPNAAAPANRSRLLRSVMKNLPISWAAFPALVAGGNVLPLPRERKRDVGRKLPVLALVRIDQELLAGRSLVVDGDVGGIEYLLQRHHLGVVAGEGGLQFGSHALAQAADLGGADLLQERRQQPADDAPGQAEGAGQLGRAGIEAAVDIDLLEHV